MKFALKLVGYLDKLKVVILYARALDAAIDSFKDVINEQKNSNEKID